MKKILQSISSIIVISALIYFVFGFVMMQFNPSIWQQDTREVFLFIIGFLSFAFIYLVIYIND
ncbi:MAG: hypothetical protein M9949_01760 [Candidatus Kapabacteria bacterium]|nr:hypothetical protein [Candidatus Kapabacteria bacterium]